jgi:hypothetical protein
MNFKDATAHRSRGNLFRLGALPQTPVRGELFSKRPVSPGDGPKFKGEFATLATKRF